MISKPAIVFPATFAAALVVGCLVTPGHALAASTIYEAEQATVSRGTVDSNHAGFTGTGFVNTANEVGVYVEFAISAVTSTSVNIGFRYANGTTVNRPGSISLNGKAVATLPFPGRGNWDDWEIASVPVTLAPGANLVRITGTNANGLANLDSLTVSDGQTGETNWADAMVDSTMRRFTPSSVGGWSYPVGLYMMGQYEVAQRTTDPIRRAALIGYIRSWADRFVDSSGHINNGFTNLDSMMPGQVMIAMYRETGQAKYRLAAKQIHDRLVPGGGYPITSDGGFWHATNLARQLWADGTFMADPFMAQYGRYVGDSTQSFDIATKQLVVYASHLQQPNGLMKHAYDESKAASWANPSTGLASEYWCRAVGWFGVAAIQVLDLIPPDHPRRAQLVSIVQNLVRGFATYQDPASGRWFQVVDKSGRGDNWTETSCSAMYAYTINAAVRHGYVPATYQPNADSGKRGELDRISLHSDGLTYLSNISIGTGVGSYPYYVSRPQATNDFHGLGAFLLFYEEVSR
ncbi:glycoside hydrolase family 88 protein [Dactylosporangium sp. NPDC005572]|uniref:glycoside hydrolase family 88 protein n=1 Tax=Dactylosporangium sp. NPDC005572 TaxID=3156889 RepID=UPI0033B24DBF